MQTLSPDAHGRARRFLRERARPLDRALHAHAAEGGPASDGLDALCAFRNADGGFGRGLEPDLRMPGSSALATSQALVHLRELGAPATDDLVRGAVRWLVEHFDASLMAWRSVPREAEDHPHAGHWRWALHESGATWPVAVLPRAEALAGLLHYASEVPKDWLQQLGERFVADLPAQSGKAGADALAGCDGLCRSAATPDWIREPTRTWLLETGPKLVDRDPAAWSGYSAKPLKLAPRADSVLAEALAEDIARNLDFEIESQREDGSWAPNWSWNGAYSQDWERARLEWQGVLTRESLASLRSYGRLSGV